MKTPGVSLVQGALPHAEWLLLSGSCVIALVLVPFLVGFVSSGAISVIKVKFSYELIGVLCLIVFSVFAAFTVLYSLQQLTDICNRRVNPGLPCSPETAWLFFLVQQGNKLFSQPVAE